MPANSIARAEQTLDLLIGRVEVVAHPNLPMQISHPTRYRQRLLSDHADVVKIEHEALCSDGSVGGEVVPRLRAGIAWRELAQQVRDWFEESAKWGVRESEVHHDQATGWS